MCFPLISLTRFSGYNVHKEGQQKPNRDPRHAPEENEGNHDSRNHKPLCKPEGKQVYIQRAEMGNVHVSGEMERVRVSYACHTQHEQVAMTLYLYVQNCNIQRVPSRTGWS